MKVLRVLAWIVGGAALIVAGLVGLALLPPVQTWAARQVLASQPDFRGDVGRLSVGLGGRVTVSDLRLEAPGAVITAPRVDARVSWPEAARGRWLVREVEARDWQVDLTAGTVVARHVGGPRVTQAGWLPALGVGAVLATGAGGSRAGATDPLEEFWALLQLPVDLQVEQLDLVGTVMLPAEDGGRHHARVSVSGAGLTMGQLAEFTLQAAVDLAAGATVSLLELEGRMTARLTSPGRFGQVGLRADLKAQGDAWAENPELRVELDADAGLGGEEAYRLVVEVPARELARVEARREGSSGRLAGEWYLAAGSADLAPFALGMALPEFLAEGQGDWAATRTGKSLRVAGEVRGRADQLGLLQAELAVLGAVALDGAFAVEQRGDAWRVERLTLNLAGAAPVAEITLLQTVDVHPPTRGLVVADVTRDVLRVTLAGLPLAWAQPWLPEDIMLAGTPLTGQWTARVVNGGFVARATQPLRAGDLRVGPADTPWVQQVDLSALVSAIYLPDGWQVELESLGLRQANTILFTLDGRVGQPASAGAPLALQGSYRANVAALLRMSLPEADVGLARGQAEGTFSGRLGERWELLATTKLSELRAADQTALPTVSLDGRVDREPDGRWRLQLPLIVEHEGRRSDLTITGDILPGETTLGLDLALTGERIHPMDMQILALALGGSEETGGGGGAPPWSDWRGTVKLALREVNLGEMGVMQGVAGQVHFDETGARLEGLESSLDTGGVLRGGGSLLAPTAVQDTYRLEAKLQGEGVALGPLLRRSAPGRPPTVEGSFDLKGALQSTAPTWDAVAAGLAGELSFISRGGVLRALGFELGQAAQMGSSVLGALAGAIGGSRGQSLAENARAAAALSATLAVLNFDQLGGTLRLLPGGDYRMDDLVLIAPTLRLQGQGGITHQPGVPVWHQPLRVDLRLSARDQTAQHLRQLRLLGAEADTLGYTPMLRPLRLDGSLVAVGTDELKNLVLRALAPQ